MILGSQQPTVIYWQTSPYADRPPSKNSAKHVKSTRRIPVRLNSWHHHFDAVFKCGVRSSPERVGTTNTRKVTKWWCWTWLPLHVTMDSSNGGDSDPCQKLANNLWSKCPLILVGRVTNYEYSTSLEIPAYQIFHAIFAVDTTIHCCK